MNLSYARPSLSTSPFMPSADIIGASVLYVTDGVLCDSETGPWPPNLKRDIFLSADGTSFQTEPWHAAERAAGQVPTSAFGNYIGSINPDALGLLNWHVTPGPARRCDVWSAINQEDIELQVTDVFDPGPNLSINWSQGNWHPTTPNAFATLIVGLPKLVRCLYDHTIYTLAAGAVGSPSVPTSTGASAWGITAIGWGPQFSNPTPWVWPSMTGMPPGKYGQTGLDQGNNGNSAGPTSSDIGPSNGACAHHSVSGFCGSQTVWATIIANTVVAARSYALFMGRNPPSEWVMRISYRG